MQYQPLIPDSHFHIYNRGNNGGDIFFEEKNYPFFVDLLKRHLTSVSSILSYCLMKNHFHLLVKTKENVDSKLISQKFSNFFNSYAKAINKAYNRNGSLFQDRFKRNLIEEEKYLTNCILYIHQNPENHGFVEDFKDYPFSSFGNFLHPKSGIVDVEYALSFFGDKENFINVHNKRRITEFEPSEN